MRGVKNTYTLCLYDFETVCLKLSDVFKSIPPTTPRVRTLILLVLQYIGIISTVSLRCYTHACPPGPRVSMLK